MTAFFQSGPVRARRSGWAFLAVFLFLSAAIGALCLFYAPLRERAWTVAALAALLVLTAALGTVLLWRWRDTELLQCLEDEAERRRAEDALRESEAKYRRIVDTVVQGIWVADQDDRTTYVNRQIAEMLGYLPEEMLGQPVRRFLFEEDVQDHNRKIEALQKGLTERYERRLRRKDGSTLWSILSASPLMEESGRFRGSFAMIADMTERKQAEEALRESERRYKTLFEDTLEALSVCKHGRIEEVNRAWLALHGYSDKHEVLGRDICEFVLPEDRGVFERRREEVFDDGSIRTLEIRDIQKDGTIITVEVQSSTLYRQGERAVLAFVRDITEQKRVEEALRRSEEAYRELVENLNDAIYVVTREGVIDYVSPVAEKMFGYSPSELVGRSYLDFFHPEDKDRVRTEFRDALENRLGATEFRLLKKTGEICHVRTSSRPVYEDGRAVGLQGVLTDITERKRSEERLSVQSTALEAAADGIVITDREGTINWANPAFTNMTGYAIEETIGRTPRILKSGEQSPEFYQDMWRTILGGEVWRGEIVNRRKDGNLYTEEMTITPVRAGGAGISHFIALKHDVTARRKLEEQLRQALKMESIGTLAGGVAHDFNNILTVVLANASLLKDQAGLTPEVTALVRQIADAGERAASLTRQLLTFSRKHPMRPRRVDLNDTVTGMAKMLRRIIGEDIVLECRYAPDLPAIFADAGMMDQLLMNLAVNARDAMPRGGYLAISTEAVQVNRAQVEREPAAREGEFACLSIRDTGGGIAPEILPRIFEPFFTTKEVGRGTGLGLATVYGVVQQHQGWIEVESIVDQGTLFRLYLPAYKEQVEGAAVAPPRPRAVGGSETILVVEDDEPVRQLAASCLRRLGYRVLEARDGHEALSVWQENQGRIDLLLTDLVMPGGLSGRDLAERLLQTQSSVKIVYTSGYSPGMGKGLDVVEGVNFLPKPYDPQRLAAIVRQCLDASTAGQPGPDEET